MNKGITVGVGIVWEIVSSGPSLVIIASDIVAHIFTQILYTVEYFQIFFRESSKKISKTRNLYNIFYYKKMHSRQIKIKK